MVLPENVWTPGPVQLPRTLFRSVVPTVLRAEEVVKSHRELTSPETVIAGVSGESPSRGCKHFKWSQMLTLLFICFPVSCLISKERTRPSCLQSDNYSVKVMNIYALSGPYLVHCM